MPGTGYRSISVREEVVRRLERIGGELGARSLAEAVALVVEDWERFIRSLRSKEGILKAILRILGVEKVYSEYGMIERYYGASEYPLVYLTLKIVEEGGKLVVRPVIALNPLSINTTYCRSDRNCSHEALVQHVKIGIQYLRKKLNEILAVLDEKKEVFSILEQFGIKVEREPIYMIASTKTRF